MLLTSSASHKIARGSRHCPWIAEQDDLKLLKSCRAHPLGGGQAEARFRYVQYRPKLWAGIGQQVMRRPHETEPRRLRQLPAFGVLVGKRQRARRRVGARRAGGAGPARLAAPSSPERAADGRAAPRGRRSVPFATSHLRVGGAAEDIGQRGPGRPTGQTGGGNRGPAGAPFRATASLHLAFHH